jgi:superfamily II DNA helicase RecQ
MLIYSGTRRKTGKVLEVLAAARGTPDDASNARSKLARRYHSCTSKNEKTLCVEDFGNKRFPVVSCTMALGMGQNWKRVRSVITMGWADPSATCQMIGRCGRDGKPGLAIIFVEKTWFGGKNNLLALEEGGSQDDNDRMDALALTPVCLRTALAIDNQ